MLLLFVIFGLIYSEVSSTDEIPEKTIEEYSVLLRNVNKTLTGIYKTMEKQVDADKEYIEESLKEAMTWLKLKEKETKREKRGLTQTYQDTLDYFHDVADKNSHKCSKIHRKNQGKSSILI